MTICIGLLASDGIVIAADAQESDSYFKRAQQKIITFVGPLGVGKNPARPTLACAFTGAGDAGYLDAFFDYAIQGIPTGATQAEFQEFLEEKVRVFHEKHIFPLAVATNPPRIDVLVGAYCHYQTCMFVTCGSTVRRAFPSAAVGAGAHFAMSLINTLLCRRDLKHAEILAAYIIGLTKDSIEGCGKYTAILSLHNPSISEVTDGQPSRLIPPDHPVTYVDHKTILRWEESLGNRWAPRQIHLIEELIEEELAREAEDH